MIFDLQYDKTLWLMMSVNKNNRKKIISFIEAIPNKLIIKIKNSLNEYKNNKFYGIKNKTLYGELNVDGEYLYHYHVNCLTGELTLGRSIYQYGVYFSDFEIKINMMIDDSYNLGEVSFDYENVIGNDGVFNGNKTTYTYVLIDLFSKKIVVSSKKDLVGSEKRFKVVNWIPEDYSMKDVHKLVKKKIR